MFLDNLTRHPHPKPNFLSKAIYFHLLHFELLIKICNFKFSFKPLKSWTFTGHFVLSIGETLLLNNW